MVYNPHEFFRSLFDAYTGPDSTGLHLTRRMVSLTRRDPLLVVTGSDFVIFPGGGEPPIAESFRNSTRGFFELTAISHLGPAVAWIFRMRELGDASWRDHIRRADPWPHPVDTMTCTGRIGARQEHRRK